MPVLRAARRLHQSHDVAADFDGFLARPPPRDQVLSWAPTSAAKSEVGRSIPSPSAKRAKAATRIGFPAALAPASTTFPPPLSPPIPKTWPKSTTHSSTF